MAFTFRTELSSIYYYNKENDITVRFKYTMAKIYYLPLPKLLEFTEPSTISYTPKTKKYRTPKVGTIPIEYFESRSHTGHKIVEINLELTDQEVLFISNISKFKQNRIYNMSDIFNTDKVDYSGQVITIKNQFGTSYER